MSFRDWGVRGYFAFPCEGRRGIASENVLKLTEIKASWLEVCIPFGTYIYVCYLIYTYTYTCIYICLVLRFQFVSTVEATDYARVWHPEKCPDSQCFMHKEGA